MHGLNVVLFKIQELQIDIGLAVCLFDCRMGIPQNSNGEFKFVSFRKEIMQFYK